MHHGSVADEDGLGVVGNGLLESRAFSRFRRQDDRKTVTFGDASAVRSRPLWSLFSLVGIFVFWWASTKAWGFPSEIEGDPELTALLNDPELSDKLRIAACNARDSCKGSFSQLVGPLQFPSVRDTYDAFFVLKNDGFQNITLWQHTKASLWRVVRGMFWGSLIGIPIGFSMGLSSRARGFFDSIVEMFRPIPPLALIGLFILTFGIGDGTAVNLLIFASVWIMIIAARSGVRTVNLSKVRAAYSLGASKRQVLTKVIVPNALPELFTGFRVALGVCWGTLVAAELVGAPDGLGAMIFAARPFFRLDVVVVGIIVIAVLGVAMDVILRFLEARLIPWRGKG
ncbi:MAG: ABC transporter permease [Actinomycetota bacterium]